MQKKRTTLKTLNALMTIQLAILVILLWKVMTLQTAEPTEVVQSPQFSSRDLPGPVAETAVSVTFPEDRLRNIVREELAAHLNSSAWVNANAARSEADRLDDNDYEVRRQAVAQNLEYFAAVGAISDAEMIKLQTQIARLRDEDRRAFLGQLGRLLTSGNVDGRL